MINRREALLGMSAAALTSAVPPASALAGIFAPGPPPAEAAASSAAVDERLRKELAAMDTRANSEEGVPVLLACVDLVVSKKSGPAKLTAMNTAVAAEFRRNAEAWERVRPNSSAADVGILIEVLAERDFSSVGAGGKS